VAAVMLGATSAQGAYDELHAALENLSKQPVPV
jgi:hypothetical protein